MANFRNELSTVVRAVEKSGVMIDVYGMMALTEALSSLGVRLDLTPTLSEMEDVLAPVG